MPKAKKPAKKKTGRPLRYPGTRTNIAARLTAPVYQQLRSAAEAGGRSLSEEIERRLELSFALGGPDIQNIVVRMAQSFERGWRFPANIKKRVDAPGQPERDYTNDPVCYQFGVSEVLQDLILGNPQPDYANTMRLLEKLKLRVSTLFAALPLDTKDK